MGGESAIKEKKNNRKTKDGIKSMLTSRTRVEHRSKTKNHSAQIDGMENVYFF